MARGPKSFPKKKLFRRTSIWTFQALEEEEDVEDRKNEMRTQIISFLPQSKPHRFVIGRVSYRYLDHEAVFQLLLYVNSINAHELFLYS